MRTMKTNYLVCYDIANPKRLSRVFRLLKGRGLHMQYSVFLCRLTWEELKGLKELLAAVINEKEDDIRVYPLPSELKVTAMGRGDRIPEGVDVFIQ